MIKRLIALILASVSLLFSAVGCAEKNSAPKFTETETAPITQPNTPSSTTKTEETTEAETTEAITTTEEVTTEPPKPSCFLISLTVDKNKNKNMCESLTAVIEDGKAIFTVIAPTDSFTLKNAIVDVEADAATVEFSSANNGGKVNLTDNCYITLTDNDGLTKQYEIIVEYSGNVIPVISIDTEEGKGIVSKEEYIDAMVTIDAEGVNGWYLPEGFASLEPTRAEIKGRGNSTWGWAKKPYKLKFYNKTEVLGMAEAKKWILLANYADYSLIRNFVAHETSKVLSHELCPLSQYPVNVFLNGVYIGVYTIGEDRDISENRIDLPKDNGEADTSFLIEIGGVEDDDQYGLTALHTDLVRYCSIEYPEDDKIIKEQANFIIDYVKKANSAVKTLNGYENYIDVDYLIDWFISTELFYNLESCFRRSCFIMKESGGLLKMGPIWDYDLAMGNLYNDFGDYTSWANLSQKHEYIDDNWMCYLMKDPAFKAKLKLRWDEAKDDLLEKALYCVDEMGKTLSVSAEYNFKVWNVLGKRAVSPQPKSITKYKTYQSHIQYIRDFIVNRWSWMDNNI